MSELNKQLSSACASSIQDSVALVKSLVDWILCVASFFVRSAGKQGCDRLVAAALLTKLISAMDGLMSTAVLALPSDRASLYLSSYTRALGNVLGTFTVRMLQLCLGFNLRD